jgi:hypothetical protein
MRARGKRLFFKARRPWWNRKMIRSAEGANYESQGQAPVLQGASPLVAYEITLERCRRELERLSVECTEEWTARSLFFQI